MRSVQLTLAWISLTAVSVGGMVQNRFVESTGNLNNGDSPTLFGRREALQQLFGGGSVALLAAASATAPAAHALDIDAFASGQLKADQKNCDPKRDPKCIPKLTSDEALCKYGQSGDARAEACKKVRAAGGELPNAKSQGKSLGGAYAI